MSNLKKSKKPASRAAYQPQAYVIGSPSRVKADESNSESLVAYIRSNPRVGAIAYRIDHGIGGSKDRDLVRNEFSKTYGVTFQDVNCCTLAFYKKKYPRRG